MIDKEQIAYEMGKRFGRIEMILEQAKERLEED